MWRVPLGVTTTPAADAVMWDDLTQAWDATSQAASSAWDSASSAASSAWDSAAQSADQAWSVVSDTASTEAMSAWASIQSLWDEGWKALQASAASTFQATLDADPTGTAQTIEAFISELTASRQNLDAMKAKLPNPPVTPEDQAAWAAWEEMDKRYHELAAGFYSDALPTTTTTVGFVPILVVAGLAAGAAGCAWAVAAYQYAVNLREQTALADRELTERVAASKEGRTLQATTLPTQPDPIADATGGMSKLIMGGLAIGAVALAIPLFMKRS